MSGDYSRIGFDPGLDDLGVLLQQGRPLTDRDWNDLVLQVSRRIQTGTLDTVGVAVVPAQTPDGFRIEASDGQLTIGRGRMYVDGLLAENHGTPPAGGTADWDPRLAESFGSEPLAYDAQPYYPDAPALPDGGPHLVYLDVWQREVTRHVRPELVEPALGVDTTTRLQTVWQVKLLANIDGTAGCPTPLEDIAGWLPLNAPSAGRLSTATAAVPGEPDPCHVPPGGGYKGLENQLYRVEIHTGGAPGAATFKWSRDNASVEAAVTAMPTPTQIVVDSVGKDEVLRFSVGDWIEITDDWLELHNEPGLLRRLAGVDDATRTITLANALPAAQFPTDAQDRTDPRRHTRIRRWDQKGRVHNAGGAVVQDLDEATADGSITVPAGDTQLLLEHGVVVRFDAEPAGGTFRSGDWWVFAARSSDASIEALDRAPPRGIHHHYAKLGIVNFPDDETNCRIPWPPPQAPVQGGDGCACTVCVTPETHASSALTVQMAIDQVRAAGGGTVCLEVGTYELRQPLLIADARSLRLTGKGEATRLLATGNAVVVNRSRDVALESFSAACRGDDQTQTAALILASSRHLRVEGLSLLAESSASAAIVLAGALAGVTIRDNTLRAPLGIVGAQEPANTGSAAMESPTRFVAGFAAAAQTGFVDLRIEANAFECSRAGIRLGGVSVHQLVTRISGNRVYGCSEAGFELTGATATGFVLDVDHNEIAVSGDGIVAGTGGVRICGNNIHRVDGSDDKQQRCGIVLVRGLLEDGYIASCRVADNRIADFRAAGVRVSTVVADAAISGNLIQNCGNGVLFDPENGGGKTLAIERNQIADIAAADGDTDVCALSIERVEHLRIAGNTVQRIADGAAAEGLVAGIRTRDCGLQLINGNQLSEIGPREDFEGTAIALLIDDAVGSVNVDDNQVERSLGEASKEDPAQWLALVVQSRMAPVTVAGNRFGAYGAAPLVKVASEGGDCLFSGNHCSHGGRKDANVPDVVLSAPALVVNANRVAGGSRDHVSIEMNVAKGHYTVVANVTRGALKVSGGIEPVWPPLNATGF